MSYANFHTQCFPVQCIFVNFHQNEPKILYFKIILIDSIQILQSYSLKTDPIKKFNHKHTQSNHLKLLNQITKYKDFETKFKTYIAMTI
jgi:hypothetical protein